VTLAGEAIRGDVDDEGDGLMPTDGFGELEAPPPEQLTVVGATPPVVVLVHVTVKLTGLLLVDGTCEELLPCPHALNKKVPSIPGIKSILCPTKHFFISK
jgi:hypothetical protein